MTLDERQHQIARHLDAGYDLAEVEAHLIQPADELSDDERDALWLFAWSYASSRARGPEVIAG